MKYVQTVNATGQTRTYTTASRKELREDILKEANEGRFLCLIEHPNPHYYKYFYAAEAQIKIWGAQEKRKTFLGGRNIPIYEIPIATAYNNAPVEAQDWQD